MPQRVGESLWPGLSASTVMLAAAHAERGMAAQAAQVIESPRFLAHCEYLIVWRFPEYCEKLPPQQHLMPFRGVPRQRPPQWQSRALPPPRPGGYTRTAAGSEFATECPRTAARTADIRGGRRHAEARSWPWYGFGVAWRWLGGVFGVALVWPWGGFVLRSLCLVYAYNMALGWLWVALRGPISAFYFLLSAFARTWLCGGFGWLCPAFCSGAPLRLADGVLNRKLGHSWPDSLCVRNNLPRGNSCHPQSSIRYPLWLPGRYSSPGRRTTDR